jgi:hypothetical protein
MFAMTSQCFDDLLLCAITALSLSKPNPACAKHQVPETGQVPLGVGISRLPLSTGVWFSADYFHKPVFLDFPQEGQGDYG